MIIGTEFTGEGAAAGVVTGMNEIGTVVERRMIVTGVGATVVVLILAGVIPGADMMMSDGVVVLTRVHHLTVVAAVLERAHHAGHQ